MAMSDSELLRAVEDMEGLLFTAQFGRYEVRVKTADCVQLRDTWANKKVIIMMERLLQSNLTEIEQGLAWVDCDGITVDQEWFIGIEAKVKSPTPLVYMQGITMDRYAWVKWMDVCTQLRQRFHPPENKWCMSDVHQDKLRKNHVFMLDNVDLCDRLLGWLMRERVLTHTMVEELQCGTTTRTSQISQLLRLLPRRGPKAFRVFVEGLVITEQWHVVDRLTE